MIKISITYFVRRLFRGVDWIMFASIIPILTAGLTTMNSFNSESSAANGDYFLKRQVIWIILGILAFFLIQAFNWKFLKRGGLFLLISYFSINTILISLFILEHSVKGAKSWIDLHYFSFEPSDVLKIIIILILAKYLSLRHIEIANIKHIIITAVYAGIPGALILLQPDFGSAVIIFLIWFGMILASGVNKKHLLIVIISVILLFSLSWLFILKPYQKLRILTFINPLLDPKGAGYNILQSKIAIGSGGIFGKGIGYGSQSRLNFLPEPETDFIFAAFAEEWGLIGVFFIFLFFGIFLSRIIRFAFAGKTGINNFEKLYAIGLSFLFFSQFTINVGMNIGMLPVTGLTLPFMSYGGSHIFSSFIALGIFSSFSKS